jgi:hypothetical protein
MKPKAGHRSRLGRIIYNEEKRRRGKLPPLLHSPPVYYSELGLDRAYAADVATTLNPITEYMFPDGTKYPAPRDTSYEAMKKLFEDFNLDHADPGNWRLIIGVLAHVLYDASPKKKVGRPKAELDKLLLEKMTAELDRRPSATSRDLTRTVGKKNPELLNKGSRDGMIGLERRIKKVRKR